MSRERVQDIVIVGGGAAAWLAAATLSRALKPSFCRVRVLDSPQRAKPLSEVALPSFHRLNNLLGINEDDLLQRTGGTFRLGEQFNDWGRIGDQYFHGFGPLGVKLDAVPFHHYWLKLRESGESAPLEQYCAAAMAAKLDRFAHPSQDRQSFLSFYSYGYHFDAALLESYLRKYALAHGALRIEGNAVEVQLSEDGFVDALLLEGGGPVGADLYIDTGGIGSLIHSRVFKGAHEDWSRWLPCDRAVTVAQPRAGEQIPPYAESSARAAGWQWRIPLQDQIDHGYAYSSAHSSDEEAADTLLSGLSGSRLTEPRFIRWPQGRPKKFWDKNCLLLPGVFDPLEATGLHLAQTSVTRLLTLFPVQRFSPLDMEEYNRLAIQESERIRDFRIAHFKATQRDDSPFWLQRGRMPIPETLESKIDLFARCARLAMFDEEHFGEDSWISLFLGQNVLPQDYDPLADVLDLEETRTALRRMRTLIQDAVNTLPAHAQ
jgi:tryptophan halogenase